MFGMQRPQVGELNVHKLRHKPLKAGVGGVGVAAVGGANSLEDLTATFTLPPHPLVATMDSDNDTPRNQQIHIRGRAEPSGGKQTSDSEPLSDDSFTAVPSSSVSGKKSVAINTDQVEHFTHRLLPVQSPEFDNVMDQVCPLTLLQSLLLLCALSLANFFRKL